VEDDGLPVAVVGAWRDQVGQPQPRLPVAGEAVRAALMTALVAGVQAVRELPRWSGRCWK
jgi:hypothetical protein